MQKQVTAEQCAQLGAQPVRAKCGFASWLPIRARPVCFDVWSLPIRLIIMAKQKRKLTVQEKAEKKRRKLEFMTIFINGKQKRVRRPETIEGMPVDEFILLNADPIWLHQHEEWHLMEQS